jgi:hypothetical protein
MTSNQGKKDFMLNDKEIDFLLHCVKDWMYYENRRDTLRETSVEQITFLREQRRNTIKDLLDKLEEMRECTPMT